MLEKWQSYNKICYRYNPITLEFIGEDECALDPLESEINKKDIYSLSANCTFKKPLKKKDGYIIIFNIEQDNWKYEKIVKEKSNEVEKPLTENDKLNIKIIELQNYLNSTDWYVMRFSEKGISIPEDISNKRDKAREEISQLREKLNKGE